MKILKQQKIYLEILRYVIITLILTWCIGDILCDDRGCAARLISNRSVVCVCNATYCDEITREAPTDGNYVAYSSSENGLRFFKTSGKLQAIETNTSYCSTSLRLDPETQYQTIEGFGGSVTDSAAINWKNLSKPLQDSLITSYFSDRGLEYSMLRVPIGGSDFSTHAYAYNELPENDSLLTYFTLAEEDYAYKIPMIKAIKQASSVSIEIVATTWSPPVWMKTNDAFTGDSQLKQEYFQTYADYHHKFLEKYAAEGVTIWAITTTNEPINGKLPISLINCLGWTPKYMGQWIENNLGPTIRNSTFKGVKILAVDDLRPTIPIWFNTVVKEHPKALDYIDGIAVHYYADQIFPAWILTEAVKNYPGKFILATEASEGIFPWESKKVDLGSWSRAQHYIEDIMEDLNYDVIGWLDWNLCLNEEGGPNWVGNHADSPVIVFPATDEFIKQPMFYAMGHFSKFLPRGSRRINVVEKKPLLTSSITNVAFLTPRNTVVAVLYNSGNGRTVAVQLGTEQVSLKMEPNSVTTIELPYKSIN